MFDGLWPAFDEAEVPITSITNGVHAPTWVGPRGLRARRARTAPTPTPTTPTRSGAPSTRCPAPTIWAVKRAAARAARRTTPAAGCASRGSKRGAADGRAAAGSTTALDPDVLTIGFARRVPSYKRLTLMLRDPERLKRLLLHPERPVQLVIAGKAHPADDGGKKLIQEIVRFADDPEVRHRIVFLPNYDIAMAQPLYPGCDVWLNNPLRPYEACGTSGMKAALNGGLNLSILDGWWDEWYDGDNGWAIPSADGVDDPDRRDDLEADRALRPDRERGRAAVLRRRRRRACPARWIEMVRHTLKSLGPKVLADPDGPRLRPPALHARPRSRSRALNADYARRRRAGGLEEAGPRGLAGGPRRARRVPAASATPPRSATTLERARLRLARRPRRPTTSTSQVVHGRVDARGRRWSTPRSRRCALAETYEGGRHRFDGDGRARPRRRRSATPSGSCPSNALLASVAELGLVALPLTRRVAQLREPR